MKQDNMVRPAKKEYLPDETIIDLYWDRNEKAIEETDRKYGKYLFAVAYNIVYDNMDCEECLNDTYLNTWNAIPPKRPSVFQAFLTRIMRNQAVDKFRARSAAKRVPSELMVSLDELEDCIANDLTVEEELEVRELARALNTYLHSLSEREQFIFVCRYYYADRIASIAKMLKISEPTVFRSLADIRNGLKEHLEKEGISYE